jgi:hypothetical protein
MGIFEILTKKIELPAFFKVGSRSQDTQKIAKPIVFEVSQVEKASTPLSEVPYAVAIESAIPNRTKIEAYSGLPTERLLADVRYHPVIAAIHLAFNDHRPLYLSPDIIWLLIGQGLAQHINQNSEKLRHHFVKHKGKLVIEIERHDLVKGSSDNPWNEVVSELSGKIRDHIGRETHDLLLPTFSTTGNIERAAAEIVLLDAMQAYFKYGVTSLCGIPQIKLGGTVDDWQLLLERTKQLAKFDLDRWIQHLIPILEQFISAAKGKVDRDFWQSIYKYNSRSGGAYITGWIGIFFPHAIASYLVKNKNKNASFDNSFTAWNRSVEEKLARKQGIEIAPPPEKKIHPAIKKRLEIEEHKKKENPSNYSSYLKDCQIKFTQLPTGLAKAPFEWKYLDSKYQMEFLGGFVGVRQDPIDLCMQPEIAWVIREAAPLERKR